MEQLQQMIRSPLYSSTLYNRRYLTLIFPACCLADVTTAVTHDGDAGMKASGKKVAKTQRENWRNIVEAEKNDRQGDTTGAQ